MTNVGTRIFQENMPIETSSISFESTRNVLQLSAQKEGKSYDDDKFVTAFGGFDVKYPI